VAPFFLDTVYCLQARHAVILWVRGSVAGSSAPHKTASKQQMFYNGLTIAAMNFLTLKAKVQGHGRENAEINIRPRFTSNEKRKGKCTCIYIGLNFVVHARRSGMDHTVLPAITPKPAFSS